VRIAGTAMAAKRASSLVKRWHGKPCSERWHRRADAVQLSVRVAPTGSGLSGRTLC